MTQSVGYELQRLSELKGILSDMIEKHGDPRLRRPASGLRVLAFGRNNYLPGETLMFPDYERLEPVRYFPKRSAMSILGRNGVRISMYSDNRCLAAGSVDKPTGLMVAIPPRILLSGILDALNNDHVVKLIELTRSVADVDEILRLGWAVRRHLLRNSIPATYWRPGLVSIQP